MIAHIHPPFTIQDDASEQGGIEREGPTETMANSSVSSRGKNFNSEELRQLCRSYLQIQQDPIVGTGQKRENFWERVAEHYNRHKLEGHDVRTGKSLETKTGDVRSQTHKFKNCYQQIKDLNLTGVSEEDIIEKAHQLYVKKSEKKDENGKVRTSKFQYSCCYDIMKHDPRMGMPPDQGSKGKKARKFAQNPGPTAVESEGNQSEPSPDGSDTPDSDVTKLNEFLTRPMGNKQAKTKARQEKADANSQRIAADAQRKLAATSEDRYLLAESQSLIALITMPINPDLHPDLQLLLQEERDEEIERLRKRRLARKASESVQTVAANGLRAPSPPNQPTSETPLPTEARSEDMPAAESLEDVTVTPSGITAARTTLQFPSDGFGPLNFDIGNEQGIE